MKKLIVVANDLERSGKSVLARAIASHLGDLEVNHLLITSNEMDMSDTFEGDFWDLEEQFDSSNLFSALDHYDAVVMDVHTGAARNWGEFCENEEMENLLAELDVEMTLVIPNTGTERCNEEIVDLADLFSDASDYIIAHLPMEERGLIDWEKSPAEKGTRYFGSIELEMPTFSDELTTAVESTSSDFVNALNQPDKLPRFAEVQICQWLETAAERLEDASEYLIPEVMGELVLDY